MSMVEVVIDSVRVGITGQNRLVSLKEVDSNRYLIIWIAPDIAEAITMHLQGVEVPRPLTHDLLNNVIKEMDGRVSHIVVSDLKDEVYYAHIVIDVDGESMDIDSRTSDALALAVRANVKIFVDESVMASASVTPESGLDLDSDDILDELMEEEPANENLDSFRDFVDTLDLDDLSKL